MEKTLHDDGARLAPLIHLCKGEAGRAIKCCNLMDPEQGYARARRLLEQRFGVVSRGAVRSAASSYAAMRMVAGSRPILVVA